MGSTSYGLAHPFLQGKAGFPLPHNIHVRVHVNFTRVNKIEGVNTKVELRSTFRFPSITCDFIIFNVHGQLFLTLNLCCGENRSDTNADVTY